MLQICNTDFCLDWKKYFFLPCIVWRRRWIKDLHEVLHWMHGFNFLMQKDFRDQSQVHNFLLSAHLKKHPKQHPLPSPPKKNPKKPTQIKFLLVLTWLLGTLWNDAFSQTLTRSQSCYSYCRPILCSLLLNLPLLQQSLLLLPFCHCAFLFLSVHSQSSKFVSCRTQQQPIWWYLCMQSGELSQMWSTWLTFYSLSTGNQISFCHFLKRKKPLFFTETNTKLAQ